MDFYQVSYTVSTDERISNPTRFRDKAYETASTLAERGMAVCVMQWMYSPTSGSTLIKVLDAFVPVSTGPLLPVHVQGSLFHMENGKLVSNEEN